MLSEGLVPEGPLPGVGWTLNMVVCRTGGGSWCPEGQGQGQWAGGDLSLLAQKLGSQVLSVWAEGVSPMRSHWLGRATLPDGYLTAVLGEPSRPPETCGVTSSVVGPPVGARVSPRGCGRRWGVMSGGGGLPSCFIPSFQPRRGPFSPLGPPQREPVL